MELVFPRRHVVWSAGGLWAGAPLLQSGHACGFLLCEPQRLQLLQTYSDNSLPSALTDHAENELTQPYTVAALTDHAGLLHACAGNGDSVS